MAAESKIEWTGSTWNPIRGCTRASPGCGGGTPGELKGGCYAERVAARFSGPGQPYEGLAEMRGGQPRWTGKLALAPEATITAPLRTRKPTTWFVNSMSDLFHESLPDTAIDRVFAVMALCPQHTFQVLTKRSARMRAYCSDNKAREIMGEIALMEDRLTVDERDCPDWPLPNVWLGVSAEDQRRADERVPDLLATPAAVRFVSAEPLLGPIDFNLIGGEPGQGAFSALSVGDRDLDPDGAHLDWIIVGGESGPGARPMHPAWARSIRDQCAAAGVAYFFKQHGDWVPATEADDGARGYMLVDDGGDEDRLCDIRSAPVSRSFRDQTMWRVGKARAGRLLDGRTHDEMPEVRL